MYAIGSFSGTQGPILSMKKEGRRKFQNVSLLFKTSWILACFKEKEKILLKAYLVFNVPLEGMRAVYHCLGIKKCKTGNNPMSLDVFMLVFIIK